MWYLENSLEGHKKTIRNTKQLSMDDLDYFQAWLYSFTIVAGHEVLVLSLNQRLTKVSFKVDEFQKFFLSLFYQWK